MRIFLPTILAILLLAGCQGNKGNYVQLSNSVCFDKGQSSAIQADSALYNRFMQYCVADSAGQYLSKVLVGADTVFCSVYSNMDLKEAFSRSQNMAQSLPINKTNGSAAGFKYVRLLNKTKDSFVDRLLVEDAPFNTVVVLDWVTADSLRAQSQFGDGKILNRLQKCE